MGDYGPQFLMFLQIVWINIVLSGDNAVVIAMACRGLPAHQRRMGMVLGAGVAVVLRIVFTILIAALLATPYLKIVGGLLLLWIAVKLLVGEEGEGEGIKAADRLWYAVRTVAIADAVMSFDNVLAIAAVAKDSIFLLVLGLALSIPLIVAGATLVMALIARFPIFVWAGGALLGWVAGEMLASDPALVQWLGAETAHAIELPAGIIGVLAVVAAGYLWRRSHRLSLEEA